MGTVGGRGGRGRGGGRSPRLGLSVKPLGNPAGIPKTLRHGHIALGFKVPALGGCPEVRVSEPARGTWPHNRFLYQTRPCPRVHTCPAYQQRPVPSTSLSDPSSQYGVTELALPSASSCHPQTYRRCLPANPFLNSLTQWFRSPYGPLPVPM